MTADEVSGTLTLFAGQRGFHFPSRRQPRLFSWSFARPWAALSGLTAGRFGELYAVPDNALPTKIFRVGVGGPFANVRAVANVRRDGEQARYDGEGIVTDTSILAPRGFAAGWWIASEGNGSSRPNLLVQIDRSGRVLREIQLPNAIDDAADPSLPGDAQAAAGGQKIRGNGFEGVAISGDGRYLIAAIQRDFNGEFDGGTKFTRIARYDLRQLQRNGSDALCDGLRCGGDWEFFFYRFDSDDEDNWAGLSEILAIGRDQFLVIERDKGIGLGSELKKLYAFSLRGVDADDDGRPSRSDTVRKVEVLDLLDEFFPYEKVEGLAIDRRGDLWIGLDNDGGELESRLINKGRFRNPLR